MVILLSLTEQTFTSYINVPENKDLNRIIMHRAKYFGIQGKHIQLVCVFIRLTNCITYLRNRQLETSYAYNRPLAIYYIEPFTQYPNLPTLEIPTWRPSTFF